MGRREGRKIKEGKAGEKWVWGGREVGREREKGIVWKEEEREGGKEGRRDEGKSSGASYPIM